MNQGDLFVIGLLLLPGAAFLAAWTMVHRRAGEQPGTTRPVLEGTTWGRLHHWSASSHPGLLREMVNIYLQETPKKIAHLKEAAQAADSEQCHKTAHALRLASDALGAAGMAELAQVLENSPTFTARDQVWLQALDQEFERVKRELAQQLGRS